MRIVNFEYDRVGNNVFFKKFIIIMYVRNDI